MSCRQENERLKEKKIQKISKISRRYDYMQNKSKKYQKYKKRKIFSIKPKSTTTTIKRESSQAEKNNTQQPLSQGFHLLLLFLSPFSHCKALNSFLLQFKVHFFSLNNMYLFFFFDLNSRTKSCETTATCNLHSTSCFYPPPSIYYSTHKSQLKKSTLIMDN